MRGDPYMFLNLVMGWKWIKSLGKFLRFLRTRTQPKVKKAPYPSHDFAICE